MKILYGVQGTGNGHITRARIMARALAKAGAEVDWVFSGRAPKDFFDMEPFGDYRLFKGLTFAIKNSRVRYGSTLLRSDLNALRRDVRSLDVDGYDLIINDFEPISAWAARLAKKRSDRPLSPKCVSVQSTQTRPQHAERNVYALLCTGNAADRPALAPFR